MINPLVTLACCSLGGSAAAIVGVLIIGLLIGLIAAWIGHRGES